MSKKFCPDCGMPSDYKAKVCEHCNEPFTKFDPIKANKPKSKGRPKIEEDDGYESNSRFRRGLDFDEDDIALASEEINEAFGEFFDQMPTPRPEFRTLDGSEVAQDIIKRNQENK